MTDYLLKTSGLQAGFETPRGLLRAVDGVDLVIAPGRTVAILGESGSGKSVTALSILRLLPIPAGKLIGGHVWFDGQDLPHLPEQIMRRLRGQRIAMIFQEPQTSLNPVMTIGQQIAEVLPDRDTLSVESVNARLVELLDQVGIADAGRRVNEYPHQLSGGMKQRVMIAIALAGKPDLLIADEPTTALDVTVQAQILDLLKRIQAGTGMSVLLITHDLGVVAQNADQVLVMYAGQIVESATVKDFFARPCHPYSQRLFRALPARGKRGEALEVIPGSVPPLDKVFSGCRFEDRCTQAWDYCRQQAPVWTGDETAGVRCHRFDPSVAAPELEVAAVQAGKKQAVAAEAEEDRGAQTGYLLDVSDLKVHFPIQRGLFRKTVGYVKAVDGVSLALRRGRTLALVGESGCGKTTVGKGILSLVRPTGGKVVFGGKDTQLLDRLAWRIVRRKMQVVFQDPYASMNPRMLVGDIVAEGVRSLDVVRGTDKVRDRVAKLLEQVGLPADAASRYPHEFSGGQRQRICIARALAVEPELIICDEPTSALDVSVQAQILNLLKALQDNMGLSYLFITHDLSVVEYLAHDIAVMYLGRIVEQGPADVLLDQPRHPYTQALLAAVPPLEPGTQSVALGGDIPSPSAPPAGCYFHPRCPRAVPRCREDYPETVELDTGQRVACWLWDKEI